jgi:hypothetical protein
MTYRMTAKRLIGGTEVLHIRTFMAEFDVAGTEGMAIELSREEVCAKINTGDRFFVVGDDGSEADCEVVNATQTKSRYVRSEPDGSKADNLLSLPNF